MISPTEQTTTEINLKPNRNTHCCPLCKAIRPHMIARWTPLTATNKKAQKMNDPKVPKNVLHR
jgi:hypothetical protein